VNLLEESCCCPVENAGFRMFETGFKNSLLTTKDSMCLAGSCLSIGEERRIVALEDLLNKMLSLFIYNRLWFILINVIEAIYTILERSFVNGDETAIVLNDEWFTLREFSICLAVYS
jgi:hypothetical protein